MKTQSLQQLAQRDDEYYMKLALAQARRAEKAGEVPVGAILVQEVHGRSVIVGRGRNRPIGQHDPTAHAEINALRAASRRVGNYRLNGATMFVTVEPCAMCAGALIHARIRRLVFGCGDPKAGAVRSLFRIADDPRLNHVINIAGGVLADECAAILKQFFAARRRRK